MKIPVYLLTRPSNIVIFAATLSIGAWAFPSFGVLRKGFEKAATLDPVSILVLAAWYVLIFVCFRVGEFFGTTPDSQPAALVRGPFTGCKSSVLPPYDHRRSWSCGSGS